MKASQSWDTYCLLSQIIIRDNFVTNSEIIVTINKSSGKFIVLTLNIRDILLSDEYATASNS